SDSIANRPHNTLKERRASDRIASLLGQPCYTYHELTIIIFLHTLLIFCIVKCILTRVMLWIIENGQVRRQSDIGDRRYEVWRVGRTKRVHGGFCRARRKGGPTVRHNRRGTGGSDRGLRAGQTRPLSARPRAAEHRRRSREYGTVSWVLF